MRAATSRSEATPAAGLAAWFAEFRRLAARRHSPTPTRTCGSRPSRTRKRHLSDENARLRSLLRRHGIDPDEARGGVTSP